MSIRRYSPSQIALHWLSAVAVLLIIALPYGADFFAGLLGGKGNVFTLHKSLGVAVLLLTLTRLALRRVQGVPDTLEGNPDWQRAAAKAGHFLLYAVLIVMPLPILRPLLHTAALACALPALAADPQPASGGWAQPDPAPIGYAVLNVSRERVESGTACDVGLYVHDELVGNLQPGASLALNLQPGAVDVRLAPNGPGDACRNGMTILAGQTLTLRAGEIRNLRIALGAGGLYLAPVADGY